MIASLSLILLCQLAGEVILRGLALPMPGPVIGLLILPSLLLARDRFAFLAKGPLQGDGVEGASRGLLAHLSLLFIPAGVGVVQKLDLGRTRRCDSPDSGGLRRDHTAGHGRDLPRRQPPDDAR
jgi:holin-like protein